MKRLGRFLLATPLDRGDIKISKMERATAGVCRLTQEGKEGFKSGALDPESSAVTTGSPPLPTETMCKTLFYL